MRPTIDKVRAKIGKGSPNTINPMLDAWWKTLAARLDAGPAALHRLPGKRRAALEQRDSARVTELDKQRLEVRSHVLTLREGELESRLRDRDRTIEDLNLRLKELAGLLRKEQATRESLLRQLPEQRPARLRAPVRSTRIKKQRKAAKARRRPQKRVKRTVKKRR